MSELEGLRADLEYYRKMCKTLERELHNATKMVEALNSELQAITKQTDNQKGEEIHE